MLGLIVAHFLLRWVMAYSPLFVETYYDEAVTGNMALHILKGEPQLFFWGQPYMGALEAYLASSLFFLFGPSALTLHLTNIHGLRLSAFHGLSDRQPGGGTIGRSVGRRFLGVSHLFI